MAASDAIVQSKIVQLLEDANKDAEDVKIIRIYNEIKKLGKIEKLWTRRRYHAKSVGVHRANRGGYMCSGVMANEVGETVNAVGFDWKVCEDATAFEENDNRSNEKEFLKLVDSDELLARYKPGDIEISSVGCTHFNQYIAAVVDRRPTPSEKLGVDGHHSQEMLVGKEPETREIYDDGLYWDVWFKRAELLYPTLPDVAQRALNAKYSAQQEEHCFHHYQRAVKVLNTPACKQSQDPRAYALRDILKSKPKNAEDCPAIVEFARVWGCQVEHVMRFIRSFMPVGRIVPASVWSAMSKLKIEPEHFSPHFLNSVLMFLAASPASKCPAKVARWITVSDIATLEKDPRLSNMVKAEQIIKTGFELAQTFNLSAKDETSLVSNLRTTLVAKVFDKIDNLTKKTMEAIATEFYNDALEKKRTEEVVPNPFCVFGPQQQTAAQVPATRSAPVSVVEYSNAGEAMGVACASILARGFLENGFAKNAGGAPFRCSNRLVIRSSPKLPMNGTIFNVLGDWHTTFESRQSMTGSRA